MAARQDLTKVQIEEGAGSTQEADASGQDRRDEATGQDLVATELPGSAASPATDGGDVGFLLDLLG